MSDSDEQRRAHIAEVHRRGIAAAPRFFTLIEELTNLFPGAPIEAVLLIRQRIGTTPDGRPRFAAAMCTTSEPDVSYEIVESAGIAMQTRAAAGQPGALVEVDRDGAKPIKPPPGTGIFGSHWH